VIQFPFDLPGNLAKMVLRRDRPGIAAIGWDWCGFMGCCGADVVVKMNLAKLLILASVFQAILQI
jgi:hypothetical protein